MADQPAEKPSAEPSLLPPNAVPQPHGGYLVPGAGGGPQPGSGRPPKAFKSFLAELRDDPRVHDALETAATDPKAKNFKAALDVLTEYDEARPKDRKELSGEIVVRVVRDG